MKVRRKSGSMMIEENLSTYPGGSDPITPVEVGADVLANNKANWSVTLSPAWSPTGVMVPLPLRLWNARCLILNGFSSTGYVGSEDSLKLESACPREGRKGIEYVANCRRPLTVL